MSKTTDLILEHRTACNYTYVDLSRKLPNTSTTTLEMIEAGAKSPTLDQVYEIGRALRLSEEKMEELCVTALEDAAPIYFQFARSFFQFEKETVSVVLKHRVAER